jgi:hypothetical protein
MADNVLRGNRVRGRLRAPKATDEHRVCMQAECDTVLSRYNKREFCYAHAPTHIPRIRGRVAAET